jgi:hypothetical protein
MGESISGRELSRHGDPELITTFTDKALLDSLVGHVQRQAAATFEEVVARRAGRDDDADTCALSARLHHSWWTDCYVEVVRRMSQRTAYWVKYTEAAPDDPAFKARQAG